MKRSEDGHCLFEWRNGGRGLIPRVEGLEPLLEAEGAKIDASEMVNSMDFVFFFSSNYD